MSNGGATARRSWFVAACLIALFVAALFLRAYWNLDAANPSEGEYVLSGGSDPYYHKRAADAIQENGFKHLISDPMLNYPRGSENPNPPIYEWVIAAGGSLLAPLIAGGDVAKATWEVAIWSPAIFGALTVFPVYFLGAALFDRRAGLVAALIWTVATSAIDAGGVGLADHDAAVIFFASLAFLFYVQTIRRFRGDGTWVTKWSDGSAIASGYGRLFRERRAGFAYALLTALSIAAVALTWKGFNYVLGILLIYAGLQLVVDHFRNRDSTGLYFATLLATTVGVVIALPYYLQANVANFLTPTWYLLGFFAIAGFILVVTRDLPSLLVLPSMLVFAIVGAVVAFFVFPTVAQSLLYATVYFKQTRLYATIAEAHPADFSTIAFGIGPVPFFLAILGWFVLLFRTAAKTTQAWIATAGFLTLALVGYVATSQIGDGSLGLPVVGTILLTWLLVMFSLGDSPVGRTHAFAILWAAVALFMAASAVRFLINAIPIFAVFAGFMAVWIIDWLDFTSIRKSLAANRGNFWQGLRKGTRPLHIIAVLLVALLFVVPTTILAADAALPPEAEQKLSDGSDSEFVKNFLAERMGAYGGGFGSVKPWIGPLEWLDAYDAGIAPEDRPAFLAWWDYGHWAIAIGNHPTVADNFQNGYEFAANFILSQDEAAAIQLLAARLAEAPNADLEKALTDAGSANVAGDAADIRAWKKVDNLTIEQSAAVVKSLEAQTKKSIRYFATDIRMLPFDNPQTAQNIDQTSIFYAPVTLKGDEPDDYVASKIDVNGRFVTRDGYKALASDPIRQVQPQGERFEYQSLFYNSMFYRSYVGTAPQTTEGQPMLGDALEGALNNPRPAIGLTHFRVVYVGEIQRMYKGGALEDPSSYVYYPGIMIVEYYPGAMVTGTVTEDGVPVAGATVTAYDDAGMLLAEAYKTDIDPADFNVPHSQTVTGSDGSYSILAPFSLAGGNTTLVAQRGGVTIGERSIEISREQSNAGATIADVGITVERGIVEGQAFLDLDSNGTFEDATETPAANVGLTIGGVSVTTDGEGRYRVEGVSAGIQNVTTDAADLQVGSVSQRVRVQPGTNVTFDVALEAKAARVSGRLVADLDGDGTFNETEGIAFQTVTFAADANVTGNTARTAPVFTEAGGNYTTSLRPGTYVVTARYTVPDSTDVYSLTQTLTVGPGQTLEGEELVLVKEAS